MSARLTEWPGQIGVTTCEEIDPDIVILPRRRTRRGPSEYALLEPPYRPAPECTVTGVLARFMDEQ